MTDENETPGTDERASAAASRSATHSLECDVCTFESFEYRPAERTYVAAFDADESAPSTAVVGAISTVVDADPHDMEPLYASVDPDALDSMFDADAAADRNVEVSFTVADHDVVLSSYGGTTVRISGPDSSRVVN